MERARRWFQECWQYPVIGFALITASACNSSPASSRARGAGATAAASDNAGTHVDVMCMGDRITVWMGDDGCGVKLVLDAWFAVGTTDLSQHPEATELHRDTHCRPAHRLFHA